MKNMRKRFEALFWIGILILGIVSGASGAEDDGHGHDDDHDDEGAADVVLMSPRQAERFGIAVGTAVTAPLSGDVELPAEVRFDANKLAKVVPRVSGIVRTLEATEGDRVEAGQVLAVLDSRELTGLKADFLEAAAAERLAGVTFRREKQLREDGVTSEAEFLQAEASLVAARAARQSAETKLHAVGVSHDALATLADLPDGELGRYNVTTPLGGQVLARHIALGEALPAGESGGSEAFVIADDDTVWVDIDVYATDLGRVQAGDVATLHDDEGGVVAEGEIAFITSQLAESSRTATARMILDNPDRRLRPGWFLTARIRQTEGGEGVRVPSAAVYEIEGGPAVFVPAEGGFALRAVSLGARSSAFVEILSGLEPGDQYVERGAFTLKAELEKSAFGDEHAH